ncbi:MAG: CotH kinase family protein, partial [Candidatus Saccharimonadaceae bacterium]|nr:CotH kinase family protein [Candidatus Saccharimonadaceae bacterium]
MEKRNWNGVLVGVFLVVILGLVPALMVGKGWSIGRSQEYTGLPQLEITLKDTTLAEVYENGKEVKYPGNDLVVTQKYKKEKYNNVELKGRGNATWWQVKKPLQLKFDQKVDLLGLGQRRKWILLANYSDISNLRTDAAFYLERLLGEKYAYNGEFVDLYVDNNYEGLYYLTRAIEVGKNAVDLKDPFGLLVELDNVYGKLEDKYYKSGNGEIFTVKDVVAEDNADAAMKDFLDDFNSLEIAIKKGNYDAVEDL